MPRSSPEGYKGIVVRLSQHDIGLIDSIASRLNRTRLNVLTELVSEFLFASQGILPSFRDKNIVYDCRTNSDCQDFAEKLGGLGVRSLPNTSAQIGWVPLKSGERKAIEKEATMLHWKTSKYVMEAVYAMLMLCGRRVPLDAIPDLFLLRSSQKLSVLDLNALAELLQAPPDDVEEATFRAVWLKKMNGLLGLYPDRQMSPIERLSEKSKSSLTSEIEMD